VPWLDELEDEPPFDPLAEPPVDPLVPPVELVAEPPLPPCVPIGAFGSSVMGVAKVP
jgi:hypothetical protein